MTYFFEERLAFSKGKRQHSDLETIMQLLSGCVTVSPTSQEMDKLGVDYVATLRKGAKVLIDAKTREKGCSRYWKNGPELAIEVWSVMPGGVFNTPRHKSKTGWTLNESIQTDMILYTFDSSDTETAFLVPFQSLRMAARTMIKVWMSKYKVDIQKSEGWNSQAVFVPAYEVMDAIMKTMAPQQPIAV